MFEELWRWRFEYSEKCGRVKSFDIYSLFATCENRIFQQLLTMHVCVCTSFFCSSTLLHVYLNRYAIQFETSRSVRSCFCNFLHFHMSKEIQLWMPYGRCARRVYTYFLIAYRENKVDYCEYRGYFLAKANDIFEPKSGGWMVINVAPPIKETAMYRIWLIDKCSLLSFDGSAKANIVPVSYKIDAREWNRPHRNL